MVDVTKQRGVDFVHQSGRTGDKLLPETMGVGVAWTTSCGFVDYDGRLDLFVCNYVRWSKGLDLSQELTLDGETRAYGPPKAFAGAFSYLYDKSEMVLVEAACTGESFCDAIVGRGAAYGDIDQDGDADIMIATSHASPKLFRNDQATDHHWLRLKLVGTKSNRDAIGASVELSIGDRTMMPTRSYLSQRERIVTFGPGEVDRFDEATVVWPSGESKTYPIDDVDRVMTITK